MAGNDTISTGVGVGGRSLGSTYPFLADRGAVTADDELLRCGGEIGQPADGEVFVVQGWVVVDGVIGLT